MKIAKLCALTGLVVAIPLSAFAQQNTTDVQYCNALARSYQATWPTQQAMPASDAVILSRCSTQPQQSIAVLEQKLKDRNTTLPPDNRGLAQQR